MAFTNSAYPAITKGPTSVSDSGRNDNSRSSSGHHHRRSSPNGTSTSPRPVIAAALPPRLRISSSGTLLIGPPRFVSTPTSISSTQPKISEINGAIYAFSLLASVGTALYTATGIVGKKTKDLPGSFAQNFTPQSELSHLAQAGFIFFSLYGGGTSLTANTMLNAEFIFKGLKEIRDDFRSLKTASMRERVKIVSTFIIATCAAFSSGVLAFSALAWVGAAASTVGGIAAFFAFSAFLCLRYRGIKNLYKKIDDRFLNQDRINQRRLVDMLYRANRNESLRDSLSTQLQDHLARKPLTEQTATEFLRTLNPNIFPPKTAVDIGLDILTTLIDVVCIAASLSVLPIFMQNFINGFKQLSGCATLNDFSLPGKVPVVIGGILAGGASSALYISSSHNFREHFYDVLHNIFYKSSHPVKDFLRYVVGWTILIAGPTGFGMYGAAKSSTESSDFIAPFLANLGTFYLVLNFLGGFLTNSASMLSDRAKLPGRTLTPEIPTVELSKLGSVAEEKLPSSPHASNGSLHTPLLTSEEQIAAHNMNTGGPELYDLIRFMQDDTHRFSTRNINAIMESQAAFNEVNTNASQLVAQAKAVTEEDIPLEEKLNEFKSDLQEHQHNIAELRKKTTAFRTFFQSLPSPVPAAPVVGRRPPSKPPFIIQQVGIRQVA